MPKRSRSPGNVASSSKKAKSNPIARKPKSKQTGSFYLKAKGGSNEIKNFDTALSFNVDATGEVPATGQLCLIPQGTTTSTRIGRKATLKSIHLRGSLFYAPGASTTGVGIAYIYVVLDKQANGAAAGVTEVLTSATMPGAMINLFNSDRFTILKRIVIPVQATAGVATAFGAQHTPIEWYHACSIPIEWNAAAGAITEITSNNVFLLAGSDGNTDDIMSVSGTCRVRFSDN